jgi:flagella basal body P-ring formation protein FlgA
MTALPEAHRPGGGRFLPAGRGIALAAAFALVVLPASAGAAAPKASAAPRSPAASKAPTDGLEQWLQRSVELPGGQNLRVEVEIGQLHRGLRLAPCDRAEPFIPSGTRLWGRANIGLRCVAGARWTTFLPVRVSAWGPALVARTPLPAGRIPQPDDFGIEEVDWAAQRAVPLANAALLEGQELARPVAAGQPLLTDHLRTMPAVRVGQTVPIVLEGTGFAIRSEAVALSNAADGQRIRVRTANGKVLDGTIDGTSVRIRR